MFECIFQEYKKNKPVKAFTLAEVLITLGIIGVVASLTIPSLLANSQKKQTVESLKKTFSIFSSAFKASQAENGFDLGVQTYATDADKESFIQNYLLKYLKIEKYCGNIENNQECFIPEIKDLKGTKNTNYSNYNLKFYNFVLADGTSVKAWVSTSGINSGADIVLLVDINGFKKPNVLGKDIFKLYYIFSSATFPPGVYVYGLDTSMNRLQDPTRDILLDSSSKFNCNNSITSGYAGDNCAALIQLDGWEIKDDYPW